MATTIETRSNSCDVAAVATNPNTVRDSDLRILIFTATYFVLDGVTLTIRRLESHLRSKGATVKICTTVGDDVTDEEVKNVIVVPGKSYSFMLSISM